MIELHKRRKFVRKKETMGTPNTKDMAKLLGYDERWLAFGLISPAYLRRQFEYFEGSDDKNTEHYRARAIRDFFAARAGLSDSEIQAYLEICADSKDEILFLQHLHELIRFYGLSDSQIENLAGHYLFAEPGLAKIVRRVQTLRILDHDVVRPETVESVIASGDTNLHRALVEHPGASIDAIERLADEGANKAVRNIAMVRLKKMKKMRAGEEAR